jgi:hypothetical protein
VFILNKIIPIIFSGDFYPNYLLTLSSPIRERLAEKKSEKTTLSPSTHLD